jgi:hypothetical protein
MTTIRTSELKALKKEVEREFDIPDLSSKKRSVKYILARSIYFKIVRTRTGFSYEAIGKLANKDHAAVFFSIQKFEEYLEAYPECENIFKKLSGNEIIFSDGDGWKKYEKALKQIESLKNALKLAKKGSYKTSHKRLFEILDSVPEKHVETVYTRLEPIVKMLP